MRTVRLVSIVLGLIAVGPLVDPASASNHDAVSTRQRVRQQRAAAAAELNVLRAEDAKVRAALAAMEANVQTQQARLLAARNAVAAAERRLAEARAAEAALATKVTSLRRALRSMAVDAYIRGRTQVAEVPLRGGDVAEVTRRRALADTVIGSSTDKADELRSTQEDLAVARAEAEAAQVAARSRQASASARLAQVAQARDQQATFASKVEQRIEGRLAEAASLARLDAQLSATIQRQQEELARRTAGLRRPGAPRAAPVAANVPLRNVRGIYVHESMADQLESLLAAAEADGFTLSGGGYRDPEDQARLRRANCPDPARSPASSCRPPTARPGQSMHERGLAVDFTYQGRIISSRSSPAYRWLNGNARRFGLYNLPSEPWHWSTNGD